MIFDYDLVAVSGVIHVYQHKEAGFYRAVRQEFGQVESMDGKIFSRASDDGLEYVSEKLTKKQALNIVDPFKLAGIEL